MVLVVFACFCLVCTGCGWFSLVLDDFGRFWMVVAGFWVLLRIVVNLNGFDMVWVI